MANRSRHTAKKYDRYIKTLASDECQFCLLSKDDSGFVKESKYFWVIKNKFPFSVWDYRDVTDHLMIVPKQHTDTLSSLSSQAALEFVNLVSDYEASGYSIYARAPSNPVKSVIHQHTHLIKGGNKRQRFLVYINKPYVRLSK
jgi:diadenosine tetraphosphate (Ap4A) HIT family hydrolase